MQGKPSAILERLEESWWRSRRRSLGSLRREKIEGEINMLLNQQKATQLLNDFVKENKSLLKDKSFTVFTPKKVSWGVYFQGNTLGADNSFCGLSYKKDKVFLKFWEDIDYAAKRINFIKSIKNTAGLTIEFEEAGIYTEEPLSMFTKWNGLKDSSFCLISSGEYSSKNEAIKMLKRIVGIYIDFLAQNGKEPENNTDENTLLLIRNKEDLKDNLRYIESLLKERNVEFRDLIAKGNNYVYYKFNGQDRFAPSRFVGYRKNSIQKHSKAINKDGRETDKKLNEILKDKYEVNKNLKGRLEQFLKNYGKTIKKGDHKFWKTDIRLYTTLEQLDDDFYNEVKLFNENRSNPPDLSNYGKIKHEPRHKTATCDRFERNPEVVADALWLAKGTCQGCGIGPKELFKRASDGTPYLEVHHIKPLSDGGQDVLSNVCALCPTCHRLLHHGMEKDKKDILKNIEKSRNEQLEKFSKQNIKNSK